MIALHAKQLTSEISNPTGRWMFAPGGIHTITPAAGEGSAEVTLRIDELTAPVLNASLVKLNAENSPQRAFFDREHDEAAGATGWPTQFVWSDTPVPGIYAEHEPSALGKSLVEGKVIRAFSPSFYSDAALPKKIHRGQHVAVAAGKRGSAENPARMVGLVFPACGTLTNNPAFRKILPLWAKNAGPSSGTANPPKKQTMKLTTEDKAALEAKKTSIENGLPALRAQQAADPADAEVANQVAKDEAELETISTKLELNAAQDRMATMENALLAQRTKDAKEAVKLAVKRGAIPAKDEALQAKWEKRCTEDPENLELLASMKGSPALDRSVAPARLILNGVQITQTDIRDEIKAFGREADAQKRGALYARNISPRLKELLDLPIHAADSYSGDLIIQRTLELLKFEFPMLSRVTTDFSAENARWNQEVNTRIVTVPSVVAYHTTNGYVPTATTTTDVPITIDTHSSVPIKFDANVLASTFRQLFDEQLPAMHYAMGKAMVDALYALITTGNYTNTPTTEALIDFDRATVIALGTALTAQGVPLQGRTLLLNSDYYGKLMEDTVIANLGANQQPGIITGNRLPMVHGFEIIEAPNLPTTGNLTGFGFSKSALCIAARVPTDVSNAFPGVTGGGVTRTVTNPDTGLSALMIQHVAPVLGHAYLILAWMYGVAKGQVAAGQILRSSA